MHFWTFSHQKLYKMKDLKLMAAGCCFQSASLFCGEVAVWRLSSYCQAPKNLGLDVRSQYRLIHTLGKLPLMYVALGADKLLHLLLHLIVSLAVLRFQQPTTTSAAAAATVTGEINRDDFYLLLLRNSSLVASLRNANCTPGSWSPTNHSWGKDCSLQSLLSDEFC